MSELRLTLPADILAVTHLNEDELRAELAIHLYERRLVSFGKAREISGMDVYTFMQLLGARKVEWSYGEEQLLEDIETLKNLGI